MDLITVFQRFPDHEACIEHLERVRWNYTPKCPHCESENVARKADGYRQGRWNCHVCKSSFNVLSGTIFQKTKIDLQKWFLAISIILNAKKGVSSHQLSRDIGVTQPTAWYMGMRIRKAMTSDHSLLSGIVEADEAYIGGKPRKRNRRDAEQPRNRRGRGTSKLPIIGVVERGGKVIAQPSTSVDRKSLNKFLNSKIGPGSLLMTDEYAGYGSIGKYIDHATIDHSVQYSDGFISTNTIEGFWGLLKRAWHGTHHKYSREHAGAYVTEACYKYNIRNLANPFESFIRATMTV